MTNQETNGVNDSKVSLPEAGMSLAEPIPTEESDDATKRLIMRQCELGQVSEKTVVGTAAIRVLRHHHFGLVRHPGDYL